MTAYEINGKEYEVDYDLDNRIIKADIDGEYRYDAFGEVTIYTPTGIQQTTTQINNQILWNTRKRDSVSGYTCINSDTTVLS